MSVSLNEINTATNAINQETEKNRTRRWHPKALNTESTLTENKVAENKGIVQDTLIILKLGFLFLGFDVQMELRQNLTH